MLSRLILERMVCWVNSHVTQSKVLSFSYQNSFFTEPRVSKDMSILVVVLTLERVLISLLITCISTNQNQIFLYDIPFV